jgi:alpha-L-arabinofuranosidase
MRIGKILAFITWAMGMTMSGKAQSPSIEIDVARPGAQINPGLYGIFFEDINHGVEGGLDGELVKNRDFEGNRTPEGMTRDGDLVRTVKGWQVVYRQPDSLDGWFPVASAGARGSLSQVSTAPLNAHNPMNLRMHVETLGDGRFGVGNTGYWGISIVQGRTYHLRFYAHGDAAFQGKVRVSLEGVSGKVYASRDISGIGSGWKKFSCDLAADGTDAYGRLVICSLSTGTVWFDVVSLFPADTFMDRPAGLRKDIAEKIAAVHPGFIRFPGGCIVEGANLNNRIKWFNTIGDVSARPGHWDLWGYHTTDGVGFQEYLQFAEDLHADAMYVFPVGMSCQFRKCQYVPLDSIKPYIREVMNALEYAMGPVSSRWGAVRAKNGHPAPFHIKYVEIGNENYGPLYQQRYGYFYDAIHAKYPDIIPITCTDPSMRAPFRLSDLSGIDPSKIRMIDEHFYESPDFFFKNVHRYDHYDRKGPKVYVGEFAVKKWDNSLKGNLEGALAEAAFYTGLERNADVVRLASLAPTLVNDNDHTWNPDLITFNSNQSYGSPSYQALKLFKRNLADRVLPVTLRDMPYAGPRPVTTTGRGMLSFTNPAADCLYKDASVTIDGKTFKGAELFTPVAMAMQDSGAWEVGTGGAVELPFNQAVYDYGDAHRWKDYTLTVRAYARRIIDLEGFDIGFWSMGKDAHWQWDIGRWRRMYWLEWINHGYSSYFGSAPGNVFAGRWYDVKVRVTADSVFTFLDGVAVHAVAKPRRVTPSMYVSAGEKDHRQVIVKVVNATDKGQFTTIDLKGVRQLSPAGEAIVLTSSSPLDENSFAYPDRVSPVTVPLKISSPRFRYEFLPHSITVIKLNYR